MAVEERFKTSCLWFSSLLSRQSSLEPIHERLGALGAKRRRYELRQGRNVKWVVAWSFFKRSERLDFLSKDAKKGPKRGRKGPKKACGLRVLERSGRTWRPTRCPWGAGAVSVGVSSFQEGEAVTPQRALLLAAMSTWAPWTARRCFSQGSEVLDAEVQRITLLAEKQRPGELNYHSYPCRSHQ